MIIIIIINNHLFTVTDWFYTQAFIPSQSGRFHSKSTLCICMVIRCLGVCVVFGRLRSVSTTAGSEAPVTTPASGLLVHRAKFIPNRPLVSFASLSTGRYQVLGQFHIRASMCMMQHKWRLPGENWLRRHTHTHTSLSLKWGESNRRRQCRNV